MYHSSRAMTFASAQDERIEELRDTHRLESRSQSDQIEQLKGQLSESEALLKATQEALNQGQGDTAARNDEINRFKVEAEKAKEFAKDEEEKRVKAISLLKTVRQKLVKAEKEKDEVAKELNNLKEKGKDEREKNQSQAGRLQKELEALKQEHENTYQQLRIRFDKEMASQKDLYEKEMAALQGQFELDAITTKVLLFCIICPDAEVINRADIPRKSHRSRLKSVDWKPILRQWWPRKRPFLNSCN